MSEEHKLPSENGSEKVQQAAEPAFDAASQSLINALRMSFRGLMLIMLILVALFLIRGFFTVPSGQKWIVERLGKCNPSLVMSPGKFHYAFPYPIDKVIRVSVNTKTLDVNVFWPKVSTAARDTAANRDAASQKAYVEGADDGMMLTGDQNILQGMLQVRYNIRGKTDASAKDIINYYLKIGDEANEQRLLRGLVQNAVIATFSGKAANEIYPTGIDQMGKAVQAYVMEMVDDLDAGLEIDSISFSTIRPPEMVAPAFDLVLSARQDAETARKNAESDKTQMLINAAGGVGEELGKAIEARWAAYDKGDDAQVRAADELISQLLGKAAGQGQVASIISDANTFKKRVINEATGDSAYISKLTEGKDAPDPATLKVILEEMRINVIQDVLANSYEKFIINPNQQGETTLELWIDRRADIVREETLKKEQSK